MVVQCLLVTFNLVWSSYNLRFIPDQVLNPLLTAAHKDGRFQLNISGAELTVST